MSRLAALVSDEATAGGRGGKAAFGLEVGGSELVYVLNLTQHESTPAQKRAGVEEPSSQEKEEIRRLLTFDHLPNYGEVIERAEKLAELAESIIENWPIYDPMSLPHYVGQSLPAHDYFTPRELARWKWSEWRVMIGGAPYLMAPLEEALLKRGLRPVYAFSKREIVETPLPDGGVEKKMIFRHLGFIEVERDYLVDEDGTVWDLTEGEVINVEERHKEQLRVLGSYLAKALSGGLPEI